MPALPRKASAPRRPSGRGAALATTLALLVVPFLGVAPASAADVVTSAVVTDPSRTGAPVVSGTARVGETLTVNPGVWTPEAALTYQWLANGVVIGGATQATYVVGVADLGKAIAVQVTGTLSGYEPTSATSVATSAVKAAVFTSAPTPTISGAAQVGKTLTAVPGTWAPSASFAYQWSRSGVAITGATRSTYALVAADLGKTMTVKVTATNAGYTSVAKTSMATAAVKVGTLTAPVPILAATVRVDTKVTASVTGWTPGATLTRQWYVDGKAIAGQVGSVYTPRAADRGKTLTLRVTGKQTGYTTVTKASAGKVVGYGAFTTAPTPKITGTLRVGQTLSISRGTWSPAPSTYSYQWRANGVAIAGATGATFTLTPAQRGKTISVAVAGRRTAYSTKTVVSASTAAVVQNFTASPTPKIMGSALVGSTLTVSRGTWSPSPSFAYQWKADGVVIAGATGTSLKLTSAHFGKAITVTVTGKAGGWVTTARTSAATARVTTLSVAGTGGYDCPAGYPIKGNAGSGIYHVPSGQYYAVTKPEQCFATEAAAVAAGYRKSQR
ncbi:hypothetical protein [Xylanimonas sp. McL0601]|uniref:sunset domain-containing protein n=1 Tax=Xylanimonas sp. McL0601 TaxID=3414739 RepID=UPI003CF74847